jgi:sialic acid synthase SpsE
MATTDTAETQYEMLRRLELSEEAHVALLDYCRAQGITFLSTPFDEGSADFLAALDVPALKIPSGEITNLPLLAHLARKGKPLILSTGMSTLGEVETALDAIRAAGNRDVIVLHCVSSYPASAGDVNLLAMRTLELAFGLPVGYSDHTMGAEVAFAAIALGACVLEKHFTLDRSAPGPDQQASLLPQELVELVRGVRSVESALGTGIKTPAGSEWETRSVARKSLVAEVDIEPGTVITALMVGTKRPGTGIPPAMLAGVIGRTARANIPSGTLLGWEMLQ